MTAEYADWEELKSMRNITSTDQDTALQRAVLRASRAIDRRTSRSPGGFSREGLPSARRYSPFGRCVRRQSGSEALLIDEIADEATISVTVGGSSASFSAEPPEKSGDPISSLLLSSWYGGEIIITAEWGWPAIPENVTEATLLLANRRYMRKDSPEGTSGWSQEGVVGVSRFDSDIEDLIQPYVLFGFGS